MTKKPAVQLSRSTKTARKIDWQRFDAITDKEIAAGVAADPDAAPLINAEWIKKAKVIAPARRARRR